MMALGRLGITQSIAYDATVPVTNPFGGQTYAIMLVSSSGCNFHIYENGGTATATVADPYLPPNWPVVVTVSPGQKISALKSPTNGLITATAGTLWVTELS